ncbi:MAG TPA: nuclear transport factor 2 family protein [Solirubrobacterales bacterium]
MVAGSTPDPDFDVIRRAWLALSEHDEEAFQARLHQEIEAVPFGAQIADGSYRGPDRVMHWWRTEMMANWEFYAPIPEGFRRVGERILVTGRVHARGRQSGVELDMPTAWVMEVRDGRIAYWKTYTDAARAERETQGR